MGGREVKELSVADQIYLCKYHEIDNCLHLGITARERDKILSTLKENGLYKQYRMLKDEEYENIIKKEKKKSKTEKTQDTNTKKPEKSTENNISSQLIADIDTTYIKVSVRTVAEWAYQKRIFRSNVKGGRKVNEKSEKNNQI